MEYKKGDTVIAIKREGAMKEGKIYSIHKDSSETGTNYVNIAIPPKEGGNSDGGYNVLKSLVTLKEINYEIY